MKASAGFRDRAAGSTAILDRLVPFNDVLSQLGVLVSSFRRQIKTAASKSTSASSVGNLNQVTRSATFSLF